MRLPLPFTFLPSFPAMLPSFASSLISTKALAVQTAIVGGGAGFSLYFPCRNTEKASFLVSISSHRGWLQRPEGYYYPAEIEKLPVGEERYSAFLSFQKELKPFLFPYFVKALPLAESLGESFLSSVLPYDQKHTSKKAWIELPGASRLVTAEAF